MRFPDFRQPLQGARKNCCGLYESVETRAHVLLYAASCELEVKVMWFVLFNDKEHAEIGHAPSAGD